MQNDLLTDKERAFVASVVATGAQNPTQSARDAGYSENGIRVAAHRLMHHRKILQAIREECENADRGLLPLARAALQRLIENPAHKDHFAAIKFLCGCLGISPVTKSESKRTVEHTANLPALVELKMLAQQLKLGPAQMIELNPEKVEW